ncbi:MAG TPA: NAD(+)/NADH kinase [Candidatus Baltobacteraceae bacterium]|nr:NAD(+)/NADH kinase [Candidatus Baltobacteraceae bacterium]
MRAIALYVNAATPNAVEVAKRVVRLAHDDRLGVATCGHPGEPIPEGFPTECELDDADLLVTVGGDGTLLRGARIAHPRGLPLVGVNTGRLGFLTEVESNEEGFRLLHELLTSPSPRIEERVGLHAQVAGREERHFAVNDVVVRRGAQARMAPFGLVLDGETITHMPSDGIIVATPTGSTGYFLSAGGPIIHPTVDALGIAAVMPHTLFARPLIVKSDATIQITCDGELSRANLETDGVKGADLQAGDRVVVRRAETPVRFARVRRGAFFARLEDKLQWGVPIKR